MIVEVTIDIEELDNILRESLGVGKSYQRGTCFAPKVVYEIENDEVNTVSVGDKSLSLMDCRHYLAIHLQNIACFQNIWKKDGILFNFVVEDKSFTKVMIKTSEFVEEKIKK